MIDSIYRERVELLLKIIPPIAKEKIFGLKGGTAINLFLRDFPRLSVDIDLVYLPFDARNIALENISSALARLKMSISKAIPNIHITSIPLTEGQDVKLMCQVNRAQVKVEVNAVSRGHMLPVTTKRISKSVEDEFELFAAMQVLSEGEIYGSKICAAFDRQHPRDLFDVKLLLDSEGITDDIKFGFLCALLSHPRPIHEVLKPRVVDQKNAFDSHFQGMSFIPFSYNDHEKTRDQLFTEMDKALTEVDRNFLRSFKTGEPDWQLAKEYGLMKNMPAVQWKFLNIQRLKNENPSKHQDMLDELERKLGLR